ncbi:MAG: DNA-processing protein DprA, partial [Patescibacteria group bacterium]
MHYITRLPLAAPTPLIDFAAPHYILILMHTTEAAYYHALISALQGDYRKIAKVKGAHLTWRAAWESIPQAARAADPEKARGELSAAGARLILREEGEFPSLLREIPWPPFGIYVRGTLPESGTHALAIVGTRKATEEGRGLAREFSYALARAGFTIVSGLALGIDAEGHRGALEAGGKTVAVFATGVDTPYPRMHEKLAEKILSQGGALVSEYPPGSPAFPYRFIERNRIVSGLAHGTLIIEAPKRSGTLATARFALDQNREVLVVPGPARHVNFLGSHKLIRSGATLVTSPEEILEAFGLGNAADAETARCETPEEELIVSALTREG